MSINIKTRERVYNYSDLAVPINIQRLGSDVGASMVADSPYSTQTISTKIKIKYQTFLKKIPALQDAVYQLYQKHYITMMHRQSSLYTIFLSCVDELIEHYQNQLEHKDTEINEQWLKIKHFLLIKQNQQWWTDDIDGLNTLFQKIEETLVKQGVLPSDFKKLVPLWKKILTTPYAGIVCLSALFTPDAISKDIIQDEEKKESRVITIYSAQNDAIESFFFIFRQLERDAPWILSEILKKIPEINEQMDLALRKMLLMDSSENSRSISDSIKAYTKRVKDAIVCISRLNIDESSSEDFEQVVAAIYAALSLKETQLNRRLLQTCLSKEIQEDNKILLSGAGVVINDDVLNNSIKCYLEINYLQSYLDNVLLGCLQWLDGYSKLIGNWLEYQNKGTKPPSISEITPLFNSANEYDPNACDDLVAQEAKEKQEKAQKKQPKTFRNNRVRREIKESKYNDETTAKAKNPKKTAKKGLTPKNTYDPPATSLTPIIPVNTKTDKPISTSQVKARVIEVINFYRNLSYQRSVPLRQALFHFDALTTFQCSVPKSPTAPECLAVIDAVAHCAQKVLEQTYRFCVKEEGEPFDKIHNLRTYHCKLNPDCNSFPGIVNKLALCNTWPRYFYSEYNRRHFLALGDTKVPFILDSLFKTAEGNALTLNQLREFVNTTIQGVCEHVNSLLKDEEVSDAKADLIQYSALPLHQPLLSTYFDEVSQELKNLLHSSGYNAHHPRQVHLSIKQALANIEMLKVGLQKVNETKDIRVFSTWTVFCLQQLQESVENILHSIAYAENQQMSTVHEISILADTVGIEIDDELGKAFHQLSYKTRYPVEVQADPTKGEEASIAERMLAAAEAFRQYPGILEGFIFENTSMLWKKTDREATPNSIIVELDWFATNSASFLKDKALPVLQEKLRELQE